MRKYPVLLCGLGQLTACLWAPSTGQCQMGENPISAASLLSFREGCAWGKDEARGPSPGPMRVGEAREAAGYSRSGWEALRVQEAGWGRGS